jgi:hypothetical protein
MNNQWLDNRSWDPTLLVESRPVEAQEPVEPEVRRASTCQEPDPDGSYWDWLYSGYELGGES